MSTVSAETSSLIRSFKGGAGVLILEGSGKQSVNPLQGVPLVESSFLKSLVQGYLVSFVHSACSHTHTECEVL